MSLKVEDWGFATGADGSLMVGGIRAADLARAHGTPLHVVDEAGLRRRASAFRRAFESAYPGEVAVHYAWKCNNTPGIVRMILEEGLLPEVGTPYEWQLARALGAPASSIVVNGPGKGPLLAQAIGEGAGAVVIDGFAELEEAERLARSENVDVSVLLRINPDCIPRGMNRASATGSRRASVFGFDLPTGEVTRALARFSSAGPLRFRGFHCHVGTGIREPEDYRRPLERLVACAAEARDLGLPVQVLDIGGGFGVPTSRELCTREFLLYQGAGLLPHAPRAERFPPIERFASFAGETVARACREHELPLPRLIVEPGRSILSAADVLLVTVGTIKERRGVGTWAVTDGGAGTVAFPLFYEYHEIFLCRAPGARRTRPYRLVGSACHSADWIYRNKRMPPLVAGDVLAICDAGAYFTVQESNFGFPRPAIVAVRDGEAHLLRRRETFEEMVGRDLAWRNDDVA